MMNQPDPETHLKLSLAKSCLRITGCVALPIDIVIGALLFGLAEVLGIAEELF